VGWIFTVKFQQEFFQQEFFSRNFSAGIPVGVVDIAELCH